jgi:hypothetical protein
MSAPAPTPAPAPAPAPATAFASESESLVVKQGVLKKRGGFLNSVWQRRCFALKSGAVKSGTFPKLLYSQVEAASTPLHDSGCISLSPNSKVTATPGNPTDFILSNVEYVSARLPVYMTA